MAKLAALAIALAGMRPAAVAETIQSPGRPVTVRVTWGGGKPHAWSGSIRLICADEQAGPVGELEWRTLSTEIDAAATVHAEGGTLIVHEPVPRGVNGVEIVVPFWRGSRISARLFPDGDEREAVTFDIPVADAVVEPGHRPLGKDGNRLTLRAAPGDGLRVATGAAHPDGMASPSAPVFRPGDTLRLAVDPLLPRRASGSIPVELRVRLSHAGDTAAILNASFPLAPCPMPTVESEAEQRLQEYETVRFELPLPVGEGVYDIELTAVEKGGLRWSRPLSARTIQVAAVADARPVAAESPDGGGWKLVYELDPGSPRLHERLRRLPAVGRAYVPLPATPLPTALLPNVSLPSVPMPSVPMPNVPMPSVPIPKLPGVALPSVADMVPRLGGLLAAGHSTVEPHPLGTMLKLPPARTVDEPSWEGIVVVGAQPGQPHLVEIEFPTDQRAVIGLVVLESDAAGTTVEVRGSSGFEVTSSDIVGVSPAPGVGRHTFAFWPATRHPLLVVANPSCRGAATFGRVRVTTGRLEPAPLDTRNRETAADPQGNPSPAGAVRGRPVHAFVPTPDLAAFGGTKRMAPGSGRCFADWQTFLAGAGNATAWFAAQGAAGAMWVVHRDGAALWPSRSTRGAPRWDPGVTSDAGLDAGRKDLLDLLCRLHDREGLRLIPALSFDAPLPALEALLATGGPLAAGIACVGRDGKSRQTDGGRGCHYNLLDPRVQQAVEDTVCELAGRLRTSTCVDGIALLVPHDGWMHMPGIAFGLDDATFARFLADVGEREPAAGGDRFARRAAAVEGPLRERWLEWRTARIARFYARLAEVIAEHEARWSLHVVPTTLLTTGPLAARFRPVLGTDRLDADIWREIAIDPGMITADPRIVFVAPQVHAAGDVLLERSAVDQANRSLEVARGIAGAARRGVVALEKPSLLSVAEAVAHGPFGNAAPASDVVPVPVLATGAERNRPLADAFVPADAEVFFDMGLLYGRYDEARRDCLRAFAALPSSPLALVDDAAGGAAGDGMAPLVLRAGREGGTTVVSVVNAGPLPCRGVVSLSGAVVAMTDRVRGERIPVESGAIVAVPLAPWQVRTLELEGAGAPRGLRAEFPDSLRQAIETRLADLRRRRAVLEAPRPLDVLDNPGFELAGPAAGRPYAGGIGGWELVEASRGACVLVPGVDATVAPAGGGRALGFSSVNGLSTLRSNPFPAPQSGRVSVAVWLRIDEGDPQPPLRVALEGMHDGREYYRFAPVGGLAGGRPLSSSWSQFVLQVDDLPPQGLESLRVRFDLLGPGGVQLDGVRVFDLAFDEPQRVQLSRRLAVVEERLAASDLGACLVALDGHWPRFLTEFVSDEAVASLEASKQVPPAGDAAGRPAVPPAGERSGGILDQVRRWWQ